MVFIAKTLFILEQKIWNRFNIWEQWNLDAILQINIMHTATEAIISYQGSKKSAHEWELKTL